MIKFLGNTKVEVFTTSHGTETMEVRPFGEDEEMDMYLEYIMNTYWLKVGKNKRMYDEKPD